jgi:hypothetical protein
VLIPAFSCRSHRDRYGLTMVLRSFVALLCSLLVCACTPGVSVDVRQSPPMAETARAMPVASTLPAVTLGAAAAAPADLQGPFEPSPRLPSAEMLPDYPLTGPRYRIADEAQVVDYFGQFELRADVGGLVADGAEVLKLRVRELAAVRELDRISTSEVFVEAMKRTGQRPITAVRQVATEPAATVSGLPAGVGRFLVRTARNIRDLALDLNDAARDAMADEDEEGDVDAKGDGEANDQDQAEFRLKAEKVATSAALRYIGYSKARC